MSDLTFTIIGFEPDAVVAGQGDNVHLGINGDHIRMECWNTDNSSGDDVYLLPPGDLTAHTIDLDERYGDGTYDAVSAAVDAFRNEYWTEWRARIAPLEAVLRGEVLSTVRPVTVQVEAPEATGSTHFVQLKVSVRMEEMDGTPEQSAEIALDLFTNAIHSQWDRDAQVEVITYKEV